MAKEVSDATFEKDVLDMSKEKPVVVDFWASWCGPCMQLKPVIEKLAGEYKDKIDIVKLNVEEHKDSPAKYGVMSIPSVKMFKDGKVIDEFVGAQPEAKIREWLDGHA